MKIISIRFNLTPRCNRNWSDAARMNPTIVIWNSSSSFSFCSLFRRHKCFSWNKIEYLEEVFILCMKNETVRFSFVDGDSVVAFEAFSQMNSQKAKNPRILIWVQNPTFFSERSLRKSVLYSAPLRSNLLDSAHVGATPVSRPDPLPLRSAPLQSTLLDLAMSAPL